MSTKIRLQRHGRKGYAHYTIVVADSRAPRDGKFIERLGNTNPSTIQLNFERALYWVGVGAQPTDTANYILKREGVMLMKHLQGGVKKGAFTEEEAQKKFDAWKADKEARLNAIATKQAADGKAKAEKRIEEEKKVNEAIAKRVAAAAKAAEEAKAAEAPAADAAEAPAEQNN
jgi:small subunit ribosomal protein S16